MGNDMGKQSVGKEEAFLVLPMVVLVLAQIGTSGDSYIIGVATKAIMQDLGANMNQMQLATMIYALCASSFMLVGGMSGIILGWNTNIKLGAFLCMVGEIATFLAPSITFFTWVGRVLFGIGGSLLIPSVFGTIVALYKGTNRTKAFGYLSAAVGIASGLPLVAGALVETLGWRIAYGCMAVYFGVLFALSFKIPKIEKSGNIKMDYVGAVLSAVGMFFTVVGVSKISSWGFIRPLDPPFTLFGLPPSIPMILIGLIVLAVLFKVEAKIEERDGAALIPQSFIRTPQVRSGLLLNVVSFAVSGAIGIVILPYMQLVAGINPLKTGLIMLASGLSPTIFSILAPRLFKGKSIKKLVLYSSIIGGVAFLMTSFALGKDSFNIGIYLACFVVFGISGAISGTYSGPIVSAAMDERDAQQSGGIQPTARNIGSAIGIAFIGMIMLTSLNSSFKKELAVSNLPETTQTAITEETSHISFMSNDDLEIMFEDVVTDEKEMEELVDVNAEARKKAATYSIYATAALMLIAIYAAKDIPHEL